MSRLMKMLNDDTTQILLAIILGIVICWFIFGRNCGINGNDGFSVGGPCIPNPTYFGVAGPPDIVRDCNKYEGDRAGCNSDWTCTWELPAPPPPPAPPSVGLGPATDHPQVQDSGATDWHGVAVNRKKAIIRSIKYMLMQLIIGAGGAATGASITNQSAVNDMATLNAIDVDSETALSELHALGNLYDMKFLILENTDNTLGEVPEPERLENLEIIMSVIRIGHDAPAGWSYPLGDLFTPFSLLDGATQQGIYCDSNTIHMDLEGGVVDRYDPLLKLRSTKMTGWKGLTLGQGVCTDGEIRLTQDNQEFTAMNVKDRLIAHLNNGMNRGKSQYNTAIKGQIFQNLYTAPAGDDRRNTKVLVVHDDFSTSTSVPADAGGYTEGTSAAQELRPLEIKLMLTGSVHVPNYDVNILPHTDGNKFKLLFIDGMNNMGTPYMAIKKDVSELPARNPIVEQYHTNLFNVQYLLLKMFMGTDNVYPPELNPFLHVDPEARGQGAGQTGFEEAMSILQSQSQNDSCKRSELDYLVLGLLKEGVNSQAYDYEPVLADTIPTGGILINNNANGLIIKPHASKKFSLQHLNQSAYNTHFTQASTDPWSPIGVGLGPPTQSTGRQELFAETSCVNDQGEQDDTMCSANQTCEFRFGNPPDGGPVCVDNYECQLTYNRAEACSDEDDDDCDSILTWYDFDPPSRERSKSDTDERGPGQHDAMWDPPAPVGVCDPSTTCIEESPGYRCTPCPVDKSRVHEDGTLSTGETGCRPNAH